LLATCGDHVARSLADQDHLPIRKSKKNVFFGGGVVAEAGVAVAAAGAAGCDRSGA
jgi:hypothetical protein